MPLFRLVFNLTFKQDFIFYILNIPWEEIINALRLFFSNCDCCVPANATPAADIVFYNRTPELNLEFMNETPESDPVFKNAITDSAYVPHGLPPVVAHEVQLQDFNVNNVHGLPPVVAHEVQLQDFNVNNVNII